MWYWPMWPAPTTPARIRCSVRLAIDLPRRPPAGSRQNAPLRRRDELHEPIQVLGRPQLGPDPLQGAAGRVPGSVQDLVRPLEEEPGSCGHAGPPETHDVDTPHDRGIPLDEEVGRQILGKPRAAAHERQGPDPHELV